MNKRLIALSLSACVLQSMQRPQDANELDQLNLAINQGDYQKVFALVTHPSVQARMARIVTEPIFSRAQSADSQKKAAYMKIIRLLVSKGAQIYPQSLKILEEYEKAQQVPVLAKPVPTTATSAPALIKVNPLPIKPAAAAKQPIISSTKSPAEYQTLSDLLKKPFTLQEQETIKKYIQEHSFNHFTAKQKQDILTLAINNLVGIALIGNNAVNTFKILLSRVKLLLENGFQPTTDYQKNELIKIRRGQLSNRNERFSTPLVKAIREKKSLDEIKRLVEQEKEDVNQAGTDGLFPLIAVLQTKSKEIADYLLSKGAFVTDLMNFQQEELSKLVGHKI